MVRYLKGLASVEWINTFSATPSTVWDTGKAKPKGSTFPVSYLSPSRDLVCVVNTYIWD